VLVLGLVAVFIVEHLPQHPPAKTGHHPAAISVVPLPSPAAGPAAISVVPLPAPGTGPVGVSGLAKTRDGSLRLPSTGQQPAWLWPSTGRTQLIGGLPRDKWGYEFIRVGGGWAVQADSAARSRCGSCAGARRPVYFLADYAQSVTQVAAADDVAPSATAGALWLTNYPPGADMSTAAGTAQEIRVDGAPAGAQAGPPVRLPAGYVIYQGTDRGLLLAPVAPSGITTYKLWSPAGGQAVSRTFEQVRAASATRIAWASRCDPACRVEVLNLATGQRTVVGLPGASSAVNGAFSPDGKFLTLQLSFTNVGDDGALAMQLDVVSLAGRNPAVVPTLRVSSDALVGFGWPAGTDDLVAKLNFVTELQVASWRPDSHGLAVAVIRPGPGSTALIVG